MNVTAIYRNAMTPDRTFAAMIQVAGFPTSGVDCDTPEVRSSVMRALRLDLVEKGRRLHHLTRIHAPSDDRSFYERNAIVAAYTDQRAAALFEAWDAPIPLTE